MDDLTLAREAVALTARLSHAWDTVAPNSTYAARLVAVTERSQQRQIRRLAKCGELLAQRWLTLLQKTADA